MIASLKGTVISHGPTYMIVEVNNVGYKVFSTIETIEQATRFTHIATNSATTAPAPIFLWTYLAVRENSHDLYGFLNPETLGFFELLITVSGIGPKTALSILNIAPVRTLKNAILSGDPTPLVKISGIGRKKAEKLVLELKDKVQGTAEDQPDIQNESDALEALKGLGYGEREAREALKKLDRAITNTGDKVKHALKLIGK